MSETDLDEIKTLTKDILDEVKKKETRVWKAFLTALPVLLGLWVWFIQSDSEQAFTRQMQHLNTRLNLSESYYKKRLEVYAGIHQQIVDLKTSYKKAQIDENSRRTFFLKIGDFFESYDANTLFVSDSLQTRLQALWHSARMAAKALGKDGSESEQLGESFSKDITGLQNQMRKDLFVRELADYHRLFN